MHSSATTNSADVPLITDSLGGSTSTPDDSFMLDDGGSPAAFDIDFGLLSPNTMLQIDSNFDSLLNSTFENTFGLNVASSTSASKTLTLQAYAKMLPMCVSYSKRVFLISCLILTDERRRLTRRGNFLIRRVLRPMR